MTAYAKAYSAQYTSYTNNIDKDYSAMRLHSLVDHTKSAVSRVLISLLHALIKSYFLLLGEIISESAFTISFKVALAVSRGRLMTQEWLLISMFDLFVCEHYDRTTLQRGSRAA